MLKKSMVVMAVIGIITACMCGCMSSPEQSSIVKFHPDIQPYHTTHYTTLTNKIYINMNDPLIKEKKQLYDQGGGVVGNGVPQDLNNNVKQFLEEEGTKIFNDKYVMSYFYNFNITDHGNFVMTIYSKRVKKDDMKAFVIMAKDIYHKYNMYCPNNNMRIVIDFVDIDSGWKYGNVAYKSYLANGLGTRYQLDDGTTIGEEYN